MEKGKKHKKSTKESISKSMIGSKNAEKYTEEVTIGILEQMIEFLQTDKLVEISTQEELSAMKFDPEATDYLEDAKQVKYVVKRITKRPHLKLEARLHMKIYNHTWFSDMETKFKENKTISYLLKTIDDLVLLNTYESASNGSTNALMAKMNLAKNHDWKDKSEKTIEDKTKPQLDLSKLTTDELRKYLELATKCQPDKSGDSEA